MGWKQPCWRFPVSYDFTLLEQISIAVEQSLNFVAPSDNNSLVDCCFVENHNIIEIFSSFQKVAASGFGG